MRSPSRLHWGCGPNATAGWLNADVHPHSGVDLVGDIRDGLALPDACMDYAVAIHVLQDLPWTDIPRALQELHRVLKPGAALRLALPDLDRAIDAYRQGDGAYFHVPDKDARSVGAKLVTQIIWYGSVAHAFQFRFRRGVAARRRLPAHRAQQLWSNHHALPRHRCARQPRARKPFRGGTQGG
jgi:ubiquinone/menaquinone biosynthesis C-methylase UbiE